MRGFPNLFLTCGPGTVLGHGGSYITIAECQVRYIVEALGAMVERGIGAVEVPPEVHADYAARHGRGARGDDLDPSGDAQLVPQPRGARGRRVARGGSSTTGTMTRHVDWDDYAVELRGAVS